MYSTDWYDCSRSQIPCMKKVMTSFLTLGIWIFGLRYHRLYPWAPFLGPTSEMGPWYWVQPKILDLGSHFSDKPLLKYIYFVHLSYFFLAYILSTWAILDQPSRFPKSAIFTLLSILAISIKLPKTAFDF